MKNTSISLTALGAATVALFAFTNPALTQEGKLTGKDSTLKIASSLREGPSIKGRIEPADAASEVWAISGRDSAKAGITDGAFQINEKPGTYKVVVVATGSYKTVIKDDVQVADGNATDLGIIKLEQ